MQQLQTSHGKKGARPDQSYAFRLNPAALEDLKEIGEWFRSKGRNYSNSCLVRRSLELYRVSLAGIVDQAGRDEEKHRIDLARGVRG